MRGPIFHRLRHTDNIRLSEELGWWVKGRFLDDPSVCFELSTEDWQQFLPYAHKVFPHPKVPLTYLGLFRPKQTVAEFQLGKWCRHPSTSEDVQRLSQLLTALVDLRPMYVDPEPNPAQLQAMFASVAHGSAARTRRL